MNSKTTLAAAQCRLQEWASQIRECQNRPAGISVVDWCTSHGITKANYYYRLRRVRAACLEHLPEELRSRYIVPVEPKLLEQKENRDGMFFSGLEISFHGCSIRVSESTSMSLLEAVLQVVKHAK